MNQRRDAGREKVGTSAQFLYEGTPDIPAGMTVDEYRRRRRRPNTPHSLLGRLRTMLS